MILLMNRSKSSLFIYISLLFLVCTLSSIHSISFIPNSAPFDPNNTMLLLGEEDLEKENQFTYSDEEPRYTIKLSTMGRGDPLYVWFGHSAIVIDDKVTNRSVMYDYGIFSFNEGFYKTFALGRLWYESWATDTLMRFAIASEEDRNISLVTLDLPQDVALNVLNFVNKTMQKEYSTYLYHHYKENCSTKIRDIIDIATNGEFKEFATEVPSAYTIRELVSLHTASNPFIHFTLNFLQNRSIDTPITLWEAMFLPEKLEEGVLTFNRQRIDGSSIPLSLNREVIHAAPLGIRPENNQSMLQANLIMFFSSILLSLFIFFFRRGMENTRFIGMKRFYKTIYSLLSISWTLVGSVFSLVLIFMMVMSNHDVTYFNENILIISPLTLLLLLSSIKRVFSKETDYRFYESVNTIALSLIGVLIVAKGLFPYYLYQHNWDILVVMVPLYLMNSTFVHRFYKKRKRIINNKTW
ncbi:MAG: DUF4105 domain-containing protein [Spirochaetia bacterium]|nr:DUF4105 domain-containing protein [Spirochaetia bacterium]